MRIYGKSRSIFLTGDDYGPTDERIFVQHGVDVTFVTLNDEEILEEQHVKELEEEIMSVVEEAKCENMMLDFCNVKFMTSAFLGLLVLQRHLGFENAATYS